MRYFFRLIEKIGKSDWKFESLIRNWKVLFAFCSHVVLTDLLISLGIDSVCRVL